MVKNAIRSSTTDCVLILVVILGTPIASNNFIHLISFFREKSRTQCYQEDNEDCLDNDLRVYLTVANFI